VVHREAAQCITKTDVLEERIRAQGETK